MRETGGQACELADLIRPCSEEEMYGEEHLDALFLELGVEILPADARLDDLAERQGRPRVRRIHRQWAGQKEGEEERGEKDGRRRRRPLEREKEEDGEKARVSAADGPCRRRGRTSDETHHAAR